MGVDTDGLHTRNHYGHKNVILRDLEEVSIPTRPTAAAPPAGVPSPFDTGGGGGRLAMGVGASSFREATP